jgi:glycosyltransferase involved in cell wall biosynthesis
MNSSILKVAYVHGRTGPHPFQGKLAKSVGGEYIVVDFKIRWHDIPSSRFRRYLSWIVCALTFPNKKKYDVFLAAGPHVSVVLMKVLKQLSRNQKIIVHLGDETLYFLHSNKYSKLTRRLLIWAIKKYDAVICEGKMGAQIAGTLLGNEAKIYTVFAGIPKEHNESNKIVIPNLKSKNIIFMGHGPSGLRTWYKGLDLMLDSFALALKNDIELKFIIIGDWDKDVIEQLLNKYDQKVSDAVQFVGATNNLSDYLNQGSLYLHCARGEAFGITILIAMLAGLVPMVSEWTGAKQAVEEVNPDLVVPLDSAIIAKRILWYFNLPEEEKKKLSDSSRKIAENYTEEKAIEKYQAIFKQATSDLGITKNISSLI